MAKIIIRKQQEPAIYSPSRPTQHVVVVKQPEENNGCLCFTMGLCFSLFGVLIAAIIGKTAGVRSAFFGMLVGSILAGIGWVVMHILG